MPKTKKQKDELEEIVEELEKEIEKPVEQFDPSLPENKQRHLR